MARALQVALGLVVRNLRRGDDASLTLPETSALQRLERCGPCTQAALARLEQITPQSMGSTIAGLRARGLVERTDDPSDRRQSLVTITPAGHTALEARRDAIASRLGAALASLDDRDREALAVAAPILLRLAESL